MNKYSLDELKFIEESMEQNPYLSNNELARRIEGHPHLPGRKWTGIEQKIGELKRQKIDKKK